jgi:SRSO17 transposase
MVSDATQMGFEEYVAHYREIFSRADQRDWFQLYVRGLLTAPDRRNFEAIAAASARAPNGSNLAQALQHFVTQSPWDHTRVLARYRERLPTTFRKEKSVLVVHDGVLLKKGRNSVGTQRQFARSLGRKVNCQVAVVVGVAAESGYVPLAARLYLPGYWIRENPELVEKTVPSAQRTHVTKTALALTLLDELRAEGWPASAAALDEGFGTTAFTEALAERGIRLLESAGTAVAAATEHFEWLKTRLGLDHFEGRTWVGWHHHAAMVFAAAGFLLAKSGEPAS